MYSNSGKIKNVNKAKRGWHDEMPTQQQRTRKANKPKRETNKRDMWQPVFDY